MEVKTATLIGTRLPHYNSKKDPHYIKLKDKIREKIIYLIEEKSINHFISGLSVGSDQLCASIVIELKNKYKNIILEAAIACYNQDMYWEEKNKINYQKILSMCDKKKYITNSFYTKNCMKKRNIYMADKSDLILAVWNGVPGGNTAKTVDYASKKGITVIIINPYF